MPHAEDYVEVALEGSAQYIRVHGLGTMHTCTGLRAFANDALERSYEDVIINLRDCSGLDSTFMGVLGGIALYFPEEERPHVMVINADEHNRNLLEGIGLSAVLHIRNGEVTLPEVEMYRLRDEWASEDERIRFIQEAHENLVQIDQGNVARFGPFLQMLKEELEDAEK